MIWLSALSIVVVGSVCCFLWSEHQEVILLRAEVLTAEATRLRLERLQRQQMKTERRPVMDATIGTVVPKIRPADLTPELSAIHSKFQAINLKFDRWILLGKYAALITAMNLPQDKAAKFRDLLVARDQAAETATSEINQEIRKLLGDADYQKLGELRGASLLESAMNQNGGFSGYFVDAGVPLTADESSSLALVQWRATLALSKLQPSDPNDAWPSPAYQKTVMDQASQFLSAEQLAALQNYFDFDGQRGALQKAWASALKSSRSAAGISP